MLGRRQSPREREIAGYPWWWLGIDAREHRAWLFVAGALIPMTCWAIAIACIPFGESLYEMGFAKSGLALLLAPVITFLGAIQHPQRLALTRATLMAHVLIAIALVALACVAYVVFIILLAIAFSNK